MGGTKWKPELPSKEKLKNMIGEISSIKTTTDRALTLMCKLMKMQVFNDGNKRTSMLIANHELIKSGKGIISISEDNKEEFGMRLISYYENEEKLEELKLFIYNNCIDGVNAK